MSSQTGGEMYRSTLSLTLALDGGGLSIPCPGCFTPGETDTGDWVGASAGLDRCRISPSPVQPIASHYTKYPILAHFKGSFLVKKKTLSLSADI